MNTRPLLLYTACVLTLVLGFSLWASLPVLVPGFESFEYVYPYIPQVNFNMIEGLGGEYFNLARALARNEGFANPFDVPTGPSAWMPPLLPSLLALFLRALPTTRDVAITFALFQDTAICIALTVIAVVPAGRHLNRADWLVMVVAGSWLYMFFPWFFQSIHDVWILLLLVSAMLLCSAAIMRCSDTRAHYHRWGMIGALIVLSSPVLAFAWLACSLYLLYSVQRWNRLRAVFILPLIACAIWTARNYLVFENLMFVKSNLYFDLAFANVESRTGVYTNVDFASHPFETAKKGRAEFLVRYGATEMEIVARARKDFLDHVWEDPWDFGHKILRRFLAATFVYHPFILSVDSPSPIWKRLLFPVPALALVLLLLRFRRLEPFRKLCILLYASYIAPYVVVAFYARYLLPLTPVLLLFVRWAIESFAPDERGSGSPRVPGR